MNHRRNKAACQALNPNLASYAANALWASSAGSMLFDALVRSKKSVIRVRLKALLSDIKRLSTPALSPALVHRVESLTHPG